MVVVYGCEMETKAYERMANHIQQLEMGELIPHHFNTNEHNIRDFTWFDMEKISEGTFKNMGKFFNKKVTNIRTPKIQPE